MSLNADSYRSACSIGLAVCLLLGDSLAWGETIEYRFDSGREQWEIYDYNGSIAGGGNVFYDATWEASGGVGNSGYIWGDDSRWRIDTPEAPDSILSFILYSHGSQTIEVRDLRNALVSVNLRGDNLDLKGAKVYFWVFSSQAGGTRWHMNAKPLTVPNGEWSGTQTIALEVNEGLWHRSWSANWYANPPNPGGTLEATLAKANSYGFSFVGFSQEVTGRFSMDELILQIGVPESGSLSLAAMGLIGLGSYAAVGRRKRVRGRLDQWTGGSRSAASDCFVER